VNFVCGNSIDQAIASDDQLSKPLIIALGNDATTKRELLQRLCRQLGFALKNERVSR